MKAQIALPPKLIPVFAGKADTRGAYGGRGSGKTRSFAKMTAVRAFMWAQAGREGIILCGRQFMNSLADSSLEEVKAAISEEAWLAPHFEIGEKYIRTADGRVSYAFSGLDRNIDSIKSKSRILLGWVDEAEPVTEEAWQKLDPTLREHDSELWVTWNPESERSATHKRFRLSTDPLTKVVELNWRDNPAFPEILNRKRLKDQAERPDSYDHVWEGGFVQAMEGAYYTKHLNQARAEGRIGRVAPDPMLHFRAFWDLGVADHTAIWVAQFSGRQIFAVDYCEGQGQPLSYYVNWLKDHGYGPNRALMVLPHDGAQRDAFTATKFEDHLRAAGYEVQTVRNQGKGAALLRIEAARRLFPAIHFNAETCKAGLDALGWYHEKRDEKRSVGLGPEHDWASHGADAFGLMCVAHRFPHVVTDDDDEDERDRTRNRVTGY